LRRARLSLLSVLASAIAACAPEAPAPPDPSCTSSAECGAGVCAGGWCVQLEPTLVNATKPRRCVAGEPLGLSMKVLVQPSVFAPLANYTTELEVDGLPYTPGMTCEGLAEGEHVVRGGARAGEKRIEAPPERFVVDRTPPFVAEVIPSPAAPLPRPTPGWNFVTNERVTGISVRVALRCSDHASSTFGSCFTNDGVHFNCPFIVASGDWIRAELEVVDLAGNATALAFVWTYAP